MLRFLFVRNAYFWRWIRSLGEVKSALFSLAILNMPVFLTQLEIYFQGKEYILYVLAVTVTVFLFVLSASTLAESWRTERKCRL